MKSKIMFIALYSAVFMFPSIGSVDTASAETDISHCANLEAIAVRPACEAAAHSSMAAPAAFDDNLMGAAGGAGVMDPQGTSHDSKLSSTDVDNSPTCRSECEALVGSATAGETQACFDKFPYRTIPKCRHGGDN
jgi:hypothetical protein